MAEWARRLGLTALASLPLWIALLVVWLAARDLTEVAAAAIAAAGLVTLLGVAAIVVVTRRSGRVADEHDMVVKQSLALVDCMKEINRRLMQIEGRQEPLPPPALAITTAMAEPVAGNDVAGLGAVAPSLRPVSPPAPAPAHAPAPPVPPPAIAVTEIRDLESGVLLSLRLSVAESAGAERAAAALAEAACLRSAEAIIEVSLPQAPAARAVLLGDLIRRTQETPGIAKRLLLGLDEAALKGGGAAQMRLIAVLAKAGLRLSLHGIRDCGLDGARLAGSAVARVTFDALWLTGQLAAAPDRVARWSADLAAHDIALCAGDVPHRRMARLIAAFDVTMGYGPGVAPDGAAAHPYEEAAAPASPRSPQVPWRAYPRRRAG